MSDTIRKPTPRQAEALENAFERESPWNGVGGRFVPNAGGAFYRMVDELKTRKLLTRGAYITAKGLRALRTRKLKEPEVLARIDAAIIVAEKAEAVEVEAKVAAIAERTAHAAERAAKRRVERVASFREFFRMEAEGFRDEDLTDTAKAVAALSMNLDDERLLAFVDRIVSREMEL